MYVWTHALAWHGNAQGSQKYKRIPSRLIPRHTKPFKKKNCKYLLYPMLPCLRDSIAFWKVPRPLPFVLLLRATCIWRWVRSIGGITVTEENRSTRTEVCPSATSSNTNPTQTALGSKTGLRIERPAINHLSHGTDILRRKLMLIIVKYSVRTAQ